MGYPIFHSQYTAAQIEASIGKTPKIKASTRTWEIWDIATSSYVDTGVSIDTQLFVDPSLTEAGYAADAKAAGDRLGAVTASFPAAADTSLFEIGSVNARTGKPLDRTNRLRTKSVIARDIYAIRLINGYSALVYAYDGQTYIGNWTGTAFIKETTGNVWFEGDIIFNAISPAYSYKIAMKRSDDADISVAEAANAVVVRYTDDSLSLKGAAADAKETGDRLEQECFRMHGLLSELGVTDLTQCRQPGWYSVPLSYFASVTDLPEDISAGRVNTSTGPLLLKVYTDYTDAGSLRQELSTYSGIGYVRTVTNAGVVSIDWRKRHDMTFNGRLTTLGITDLTECQAMGYYTDSNTHLSSLTDLPDGYPTDKAIVLKVYRYTGTTELIRQELSNSNGPVWVRVIRVHDGTVSISTDWNCPSAGGRDSINVLLVGNSFTQDENSYLPALLGEAFPDLIFNIGILYHGNSVLADHVEHMTEDSPYSNYSEYSTGSAAWTTTTSVKLSAVLARHRWDIVSFTQANRGMVDYAVDIKPYLMQLIDGYTSRMAHNVQFALGFSHIYATNYDGTDHIPGTGNTSASFYELVAPNMEKVLNELPVSDVFPTGTAVQNARTTSLDQYGSGDYKDMTYDGRHLQEGVCCLVPAYVMLLKIAELIGDAKTGIFGSQIIPTAEWVQEHNIPGQHGTSQGATAENCLLAAKCAIMAVRHPFTITDCSGFDPE